MKRLLIVIAGVLALSQLLACGCSDRILTVNVDILSFMDPTLVAQTYGVSPLITPAAPVVITSPVQKVNLAEGLADITDPQNVTLHIASEFANETGSAHVLLEVFVADNDADSTTLYSTTPYIQESFDLAPASTDTVTADVGGDNRLGELLTGEALKLGMRMTFNATGSPANVRGVETLTRFAATVVAKRHMP